MYCSSNLVESLASQTNGSIKISSPRENVRGFTSAIIGKKKRRCKVRAFSSANFHPNPFYFHIPLSSQFATITLLYSDMFTLHGSKTKREILLFFKITCQTLKFDGLSIKKLMISIFASFLYNM